MPDRTLLDEVKKLLEQYTEAFDACDGVAIAALYHVPSVSVRGDGSVQCFQSRDELQRFFRGVAEGYQREGNLGPGRYHGLTVQPIGGRSVLATLTWQFVLKDGSILREWRQSYNLLRVDGRWQIFVSTFHLD
jgi:hypothetical protein